MLRAYTRRMTLEQISLIKDIVTIAATSVAAIIAILGFGTWRRQLVWKTKYDLAQRMARATHKIRDAIAQVRDPIGHESEGDQKDDIKAMYKKRWQRVRDAFVELDTVSLEAEAIWGQIVKKNLTPLVQCASTLFSTIEIYLDKMDHPQVNFSKDIRERQIIFGAPGETDNFFSNEISEAVSKVEQFLKPYLKI